MDEKNSSKEMIKCLSRLIELRKSAGLSQKQMSEIVNVSQSCLSRYERGKLSIPLTVVVAMAEYYDVSMDYIAGLTDKKYSYKEWR